MKTNPVSKSLFFQGRPHDLRLGQCVTSESYESEIFLEGLGILGSPDDLGVGINLGRLGAKDGPDAIRGFFYRMTPACDSQKSVLIRDFGNVSMGSDISGNHKSSFEIVNAIGTKVKTLITLGGGHDYSFPHVSGWFNSRSGRKGLISVDPHFDLRESVPSTHSGTGIREIISNNTVKGEDLVIFGASKGRNSRSHFEFAVNQKIQIEWIQNLMESEPVAKFEDQLVRLSAACDHVAVTFDLDACTDALGVSARCVLGFTCREMIRMAFLCGKNDKVHLLDLCEVAPNLEQSQSAAAITAEMMYAFALGKNLI